MINWEEINKRLGISTFEDEKKLYPEKFAPPNPFSGGITGFDKEENDLPAWADAPHFGTSDTATAQSTPSGLEKNIQKAETEESEYQENEYEIKQQIFNKIQEDETAFNALMGYADAGQGSNVFNALSESSKEYGILSGEQYGRALTAPDTADKKETERYDLDLDLDINTDVFGSTPAVSTPKSTFDFFQLEVGNMITDAIKKDIKEFSADLSYLGGIIEEETKGAQPKTGWTDMNFFEKTAEVLQKVDKNIWQTPITIGSYIIGSGENTLRALEWQGFNALKPLADKLDSWQQIASQYVDDNMFQKFVGAGTSMATFFIPAVGTFKLATMVGKFSPRLASLAGGNMMTLFESALEAGDVYDTQKKMGADHETANAWADFTFWGNTALLGATNMLGIFNPAFTRGLIKTMVSSGLEGIQEGGQTMMSNVATGKPIMDDTFESFILGAVMGGVMGGYQSIQEGKDMSLDPEIQAVREAFQSRAGFAQIPGKQLVPGEQDDITKAKAEGRSFEEFVGSKDKLFHQTLDNKIEQTGFSSNIKNRGFASSRGDTLGTGVFLKSSNKEIPLLQGKHQIETFIDKNSKIKVFKDRAEVEKFYFDNIPEYAKLENKQNIF